MKSPPLVLKVFQEAVQEMMSPQLKLIIPIETRHVSNAAKRISSVGFFLMEHVQRIVGFWSGSDRVDSISICGSIVFLVSAWRWWEVRDLWEGILGKRDATQEFTVVFCARVGGGVARSSDLFGSDL